MILGVPQRSVFGPLIFLIFINDLPIFLKSIFSKLLADDTTLLFSGDDIDSCISSYKNGLEALINWCDHNRLYINWSKTFIYYSKENNRAT